MTTLKLRVRARTVVSHFFAIEPPTSEQVHFCGAQKKKKETRKRDEGEDGIR